MRAAGRAGLVASRPVVRVVPGAILLLSLIVALAACTGEDAERATNPPAPPRDGVLAVRAFEWGFAPDAIVLQRGQQVRIVLQNEGDILHNLKIEEFAADTVESRSTGGLSADEGELFVGAAKGEEGTLSFVPRESGAFVFYCTIRDHRQLGMEGALTVE